VLDGLVLVSAGEATMVLPAPITNTQPAP
jgi:hypothetical protein